MVCVSTDFIVNDHNLVELLIPLFKLWDYNNNNTSDFVRFKIYFKFVFNEIDTDD